MTLQPPIPGPAERDQADHADCGKLATEAILRRVTGNPNVSIPAPDNATAWQIANVLPGGVHFSVIDRVPTSDELGHNYAVFGVHCDPWANPVSYQSGVNHWLATWAVGQAYQCWTSQYINVDLAACHNPAMGTILIAPPQEDDNMALGPGFWQGLAKLLSGSLLKHERATNGTDGAVATDLAGNPNDFVNQVSAVLQSQEFQNQKALLDWLTLNGTDGKGHVTPDRLKQALGAK